MAQLQAAKKSHSVQASTQLWQVARWEMLHVLHIREHTLLLPNSSTVHYTLTPSKLADLIVEDSGLPQLHQRPASPSTPSYSPFLLLRPYHWLLCSRSESSVQVRFPAPGWGTPERPLTLPQSLIGPSLGDTGCILSAVMPCCHCVLLWG